MPRPISFRRGVGTGSPRALGRLPFPDPSLVSLIHDDFHKYTAGDWVLSGAGTPTRAIVADVDGGILRLGTTTPTTAAGDANGIHWAGGAGALRRTFTFTPGKALSLKVRWRVDNIATFPHFIGLTDALDTTVHPFAPSQNCIAITVAGGAVTFWCARAGTAVPLTYLRGSATAGVPTLTNNVFAEVAMTYNGADELSFSLNGVLTAFSRLNNLSSLLPSLPLAFGVACQSPAGGVRNLDLDYFTAIKER